MLIHDLNNLRGDEWVTTVEGCGDEELEIIVKSSPEEVILDITHYDGIENSTYLHSNAFIFDDSRVFED